MQPGELHVRSQREDGRFIGLMVVCGLVEEGEELIELLVGYGVVFVMVALGAAEGRADPGL